jgi:peptidoglycan/xylan/chitin deacetylase (PgdA/CDA1 family)
MAALVPGHERGCVKVLMYHDVPPEQLDQFRRQMEYVARAYEIIDYAAFCQQFQTHSGDGRGKILITFDDGFASNRIAAEQVLAPLGARAVFFVLPGFIACGSREEQEAFITSKMYPRMKGTKIPEHLRPMGWTDLRSLQEQGHTIGAHTCTHARLSLVTARAELEAEILGGADIMEAKLGRKVEAFAYPFGNVRSITSAALGVARRRYAHVFSGVRGNNTKGISPLAVRREAVSPHEPCDYLGFLIAGGLSLYYARDRSRLDAMAAQAGTRD